MGIGELALDPTLFGSSTTLLNADHQEVYFNGMPEWHGKVYMCVLCSLLMCKRRAPKHCKNADPPQAWR